MWLAGALALALLAGGCGGGGDDAAGPSGPPAAAPLGEPVTATVGATGGTVAFTASGVAGSLTIPAGALAADTAITVTPVAPGAEEWARLDVTGTDTVLERPATLTLTLPAGSTLDAAAAVTQLGTEGDVLLPASVDTAQRQVTVPVQRFSAGVRTVQRADDRQRARATAAPAASGDPSATLILNMRFLVRLRVITAESRYQRLVSFGDYSSILELSLSIAALLQSSGLDGYEAEALPWLRRAETAACVNLQGSIERARSEPAPTTFDPEGNVTKAYVTRLSAPVLYWSNVVDRLGGSCPGLDPSGALRSVHQRLLDAIAKKLIERQDRASLQGVVGEAAAALALKRQADTLAATRAGPRSSDERAHALGATAALEGRSSRLDVATNPALLGAQIRDEVTTPAFDPIRAGVWKGATASGSTSAEYGRSLQVYGADSPLADDVQQIGTTLVVNSYAEAGAGRALGQVSTGRAATPQQSVTTATLGVNSTGEIRLSGPIDVLKCPDAASERLVIEFEGVQVLERFSAGDRLLQGTLTFGMPDLLRAVGIDPKNATRHPLRVKRVGSSCNATFGTRDAVLATVTLSFAPERRIYFSATTGGDYDGPGIESINADGTGHAVHTINPPVVVCVPDGDTPSCGFAVSAQDQQPALSPDGTQLAFSRPDAFGANKPDGIMLASANGGGIRSLTNPQGREVDHSPSWSPDGRRIAYVHYSGDSSQPQSLRVVNLDGSGVVQLANITEISGTAWSPDGTTIAFVRGASSPGVYLVAADGSGQPRLLMSSANASLTPSAWSPDGQRVAFRGEYDASRRAGLLVVNADGTGLTALMHGLDSPPAWSPDGRELAYVGCAGSGCFNSIHVLKMEDGTVRQLGRAGSGFFRGDLSWR